MVTTFCTELTFAVVTKARSRDVETSLRGQQRHHICTAFTCNYTTLFNYYHQHTLLCFTCTTNAQLVSRVCFAITCCVCTCLYNVYYSPGCLGVTVCKTVSERSTSPRLAISLRVRKHGVKKGTSFGLSVRHRLLPFDHQCLENRKSQRNMSITAVELNIISTGPF